MSMPETTGKRKNLEALRVYAPSRGNLAIDSEALPYTRVAEPAPARQPRRRPALVPVAPAQKRRTLAEVIRENKRIAKSVSVICVLAAAFALIVMLHGYNDISAAQKEINELSTRVSDMEGVVEKANVEYLFSIDVGSAREAAGTAGMTYSGIGGSGN